ncbi:MAG: Gldg family protein [Rhizomicrobium sp.]|nr:Gldg family protein [Rhizomicrobium sp.]
MKPLSRRRYAIAALGLAVAVFLAFNIAIDSAITNAKLDLTENGRFTLAKGTRAIITNLHEPVTLRFFFSKKTASEYAQTRTYAGRVRDLLHAYAARSHGKIILEEVDPEPFTPAEDEATAAGISGVPTETGDTVYFGLVGTNRIDGREVISYFAPDREGLLEYDISSLIYRLSAPKKNKLAILSGLPLDTGMGGPQAMMQGQSRPFAIYAELAQAYQTEMLAPDFTAIPADADVLMIVHPGTLSDAQTYAIDQFVLKGGRALVFVDPNSELASSGAEPGAAASFSTMPRLFQAWGIAFNTNKEIADLKLAQRVQLTRDGPPLLYPLWLHLTDENFSSDDPVAANLKVLNLASVGSLRPLKNATTKFASLVGSSNQAALMDVSQMRMQTTAAPDSIAGMVAPSGQEYIIAARLTGPAKTAYPATAAVKEAKNINVIVMADSDIFDDRFWVRIENMFGKQVAAPFANNDAFVVNAVENLTGSSDLISLRTRATNDRPFIRVKEIQADAERQFKQQEDALKARLAETEAKLKNLQTGQAGGKSVGITPQQQTAIETFKRQLAEIRTQLRQVQHDLRQDVDALGGTLAFLNILVVPLLVAIFAMVLAWLRRRRRARAIPL